jgi:hypothetical protein
MDLHAPETSSLSLYPITDFPLGLKGARNEESASGVSALANPLQNILENVSSVPPTSLKYVPSQQTGDSVLPRRASSEVIYSIFNTRY